MPYPQDQARAIFLDIKRRKGERAAKKFGRKHRADLSGAYGRTRAYTAPGRR
jgi:hypothetical protein